MEVGCLQQCQNFEDRRTDQEVMENILRIADLYEPAGFDFLLMAEHHFHGYSMTPSPPNFLAYMAGRTTKIKLGSGVIIVPWNDPYRAATQVALGSGEDDSTPAFDKLDRALVKAMEQSRHELRDDVLDARRGLSGATVGAIVLSLGAAVAVALGLWPRLMEYR